MTQQPSAPNRIARDAHALPFTVLVLRPQLVRQVATPGVITGWQLLVEDAAGHCDNWKLV